MQSSGSVCSSLGAHYKVNSYCAVGRHGEMRGRPQAQPPPRVTRCDVMLPCAPAFASSPRLSERPDGAVHQCGCAKTLQCDEKEGGQRARLYTLINYTYSQIPRHFPIIPRLLTPSYFLPASTHPPSSRRPPLPSICALYMKGNS